MESLPLAGLLGLLLQAALATALLRFWLRQGESFYLLNVGNASGVVYVVELVAWVVGFLLLILGRIRAALQVVELYRSLGIGISSSGYKKRTNLCVRVRIPRIG